MDGSTNPVVARDTVRASTGISADLPLQQFMTKKVMRQDLTGIIPLTTNSDPMLQGLANAVTAFTNICLEQNLANKRK